MLKSGTTAKRLIEDAKAKFKVKSICDATKPPAKLPKTNPLEFIKFAVAKTLPCSFGELILPMREVDETLM